MVMYQVGVGYVPGPRWLCTRLVHVRYGIGQGLAMYQVSVGYVKGPCWLCTRKMLLMYQVSVGYVPG